MDKKLEELIDELQQESVASNPVKPFNQPDLIAVSSVNRTSDDTTQNGYSSFTVNLPLPAIDVKSLQLLQTNIPQANPSIPNTACVFWYYRLSQYSGLTPSLDNLHYVRLLPTNYKQEYIETPSDYGYNQTFNSYSALAVQLAKSCSSDLLWNNVKLVLNVIDEAVDTYIPYIPSDISITYDTSSNKFKMTGLNTQVAYISYDANTLYAVGDIITNTTRTKAFVNRLASLGVSPDLTTFPAWVQGTNYAVGNVITFNNIVYQLTTNGENVNTNPAIQTPAFYTRLGRALPVASYTAWVSGTNYAIGDAVSFGGVVYVLFADGETTNVNPSLQPTKWVSQPTQITVSTFWLEEYIEIVGEWFAGLLYPTGTVVEYQGDLYQSTSSSDSAVGSLPTNTLYWTSFSTDFWYRYLITGYDDPLVRKMQGELFNVEWNSGRTYNVDDVVEYEGDSYIATKTNRGVIPADSSSAWDYADAPKQTGLYGLTKLYDMTEIENLNYYENFPFGVGGQPYNPNPKRLLNSILGFTWNGRFNPSALTDIASYDTAVLTTQQQPLLYNRLRPVPTYVVEINPPLLTEIGDGTASVSLTYTAESYANLVYSSVISIYADIVKASSVDTQGTTRLLALTSMNCGNLGIAFWSNYLENPLLKVQGDIYAVYIEFRDEFNEPFVLPNSAVATLTFKLNY